MSEIIDNKGLIEQVIDKHKRFLESFNTEFLELENRLNTTRQQSDSIKKEIEATDSRITVLNEKHYLLFYQAKKQREELSSQVIDRMRAGKAANVHDITRIISRVEEFEKKLQTSKNIEDEEKIIAEIKKLIYELESAAKKAGVIITGKGIADKLNEANSSHKELLSLQDKPEQNSISAKEYDKQLGEIEGRYNWLKHRIESHNNALTYWEKQKGGIRVE
jgi:TolA-binding protein